METSPSADNKWTDPHSGLTFVWIPTGSFLMGSPVNEAYRWLDEGPVHEVALDGFWLSPYLVTNAQFRCFDSAHDSGAYLGHRLNRDSQPVVMVTWHQATAYCRWLSQAGSERFRLPTEAEWEYACRAGTHTSRYWGDAPEEACRYANVHNRTKAAIFDFKQLPHDCWSQYFVSSPVGSFLPNAFGLYDMLGNVWEWVEDWYGEDYYDHSPRRNPPGPQEGLGRIRRGGGWCYDPPRVRAAVRGAGGPETHLHTLGFRVVREPG